MQIGKYREKILLEIFTIESIIYSDKEFLDKAKLTADSKSNAKRKTMKEDNFASKVLVTQISGSAALDAIIEDSDCRGPLWDLIAGQDCR